MNSDQFEDMPSEPWPVVGLVVKARRERLGLKQEDLRRRQGPGVSTVGKVERAAQESFPLRTQHALENALGWERGAIESLMRAVSLPEDSWWGDEALRKSYLREMVDEDIPDLSGDIDASPVARASQLTDDELLAELTYRMKRYASEKESDDHGTQATPQKIEELEASEVPRSTNIKPGSSDHS